MGQQQQQQEQQQQHRTHSSTADRTQRRHRRQQDRTGTETVSIGRQQSVQGRLMWALSSATARMNSVSHSRQHRI
jgi:hypothetical protein